MADPAAGAPGPGPHERFPWAPAVLCAASLAMAAWTWMRCSYCWELPPQRWEWDGLACWLCLFQAPNHRHTYDDSRDPLPAPERYVHLEGKVVQRVHGCPLRSSGWSLKIASKDRVICIDYPELADAPATEGDAITVRGRVILGIEAYPTVRIDATASRLHPASVAGLVVAAFGTFVFGLYLRRWLKERRGAAASGDTLRVSRVG